MTVGELKKALEGLNTAIDNVIKSVIYYSL